MVMARRCAGAPIELGSKQQPGPARAGLGGSSIAPYRRDLTFDPGATPPGFFVYLVPTPRFIIGLIITDFAQLTHIMNFSCICGIAVVGRGLIT
jgi:hypothetical protein